MSVSGISNSDAWTRFVRTTQEARIRNNGLVKLDSQPKLSAVKAGVKSSPQTAGVNKMNVRNAVPDLYSRRPEKSSMSLGNYFDAYA